MKPVNYLSTAIFFLMAATNAFSQKTGNDVTAPLHALKPDYITPYGAPTAQNVKQVLDKVFN